MTPLTEARLAEIRERHAKDVEMYAAMPGLSSKPTERLVADRASLLAHVESLQAALRQAEEERLNLATVVLRKCTDLYSSRITIDAAVKLSKRIVAAANGGRDGG